MEIWAENESGEESLTNVAPAATITSVGGDYGTKSNLTDEDYSSLYVFNGGGMSTLPDGAWIEMELDREYPVKSMEAAFELCLLTKTISSLPSISMGRVQLTRNGRHSLPE